MKQIAYLCLDLCLVSGCTPKTPGAADRVTSDYEIRTIRWTSGGTTTIAIAVKQQNSQTAVCGAFVDASKLLGTDGQNVLPYVSVHMAGEQLMYGLEFLPEIRDRRSLRSAGTKCAISEKPWRAEYDSVPLRLELHKKSYQG